VEEVFKVFAGYAALGLEMTAAVLITIGGIEAVIGLIRRSNRDPQKPFQNKKAVWLHLGVWLLLGLEFELGADIIRSAISPTWEQLGQLAAVAVVRTFLNYVLEKDVEKYVNPKSGTEIKIQPD